MHRPHARTTQGPVRACHGSHLLEARPPSLEHPSISSTLTVGDDVIADGVTLLNVVRMLGPGEPVRTGYRVLKTSFHKFQSNHRERSKWQWVCWARVDQSEKSLPNCVCNITCLSRHIPRRTAQGTLKHSRHSPVPSALPRTAHHVRHEAPRQRAQRSRSN